MSEDPILGKGEEMLPDKGIPFDDVYDSPDDTEPELEDTTMMSAISDDELLEWEDEFAGDLGSVDASPAGRGAFNPDTGVEVPAASGTDPLVTEDGPESVDAPDPAAISGTGRPLDLSEEPAAAPDETGSALPAPDDSIHEEPKTLVTSLTNEELAELRGDVEAPPASAGLPSGVISNQALAAALLGLSSSKKEPAKKTEPEMAGDAPPEDFTDQGHGAGFEVPDHELAAAMSAEADTDGPLPVAAIPGAPSEITETGSSTAGTPGKKPETQPLFEDVLAQPGPTTESMAPGIVDDLAAKPELLSDLVTRERISKLWDRADRVQAMINQEIDGLDLARELLNHVRSAKTLILAGEENFEEAERALGEAEYRVSYSQRVKVWTKQYGLRLGTYLVAFAILHGIGMTSYFLTDSPPLPLIMYAMFWGGMGGAVGGLLSLWRHIAVEQDFNPQFNTWYYLQPILGVPIGAFIYGFINVGFAVSISGADDVIIQQPLLIFILAWIAGFQQNVVYNIVREILRLFRIQRDE